jgi:hypothetical protein
MSGVGGRRMRRVEIEERISFAVDRIRMGLSKVEIQHQLGSRFCLSETQSRIWYHKAADSLISIDKEQIPRVRAAMIEVVHAQIIGLQQDLSRVTTEIQSCELARETRARIQMQLIDADERDRDRLKRELAAVKTIKPRYYLDCVSQRSKVRISIVKCIVEISRLNGLYVEELPILRAIQIMANSELIPADTASGLLGLLGNLESSIDSLRAVTIQTTDLN